MDWPIYFKDQLIIGDIESPVGVCCLWTLKENIAAGLDKSRFCLLGQLYSKDGIKYILRNVLANPKIRFIILCGQDRTLSGKDFLEIMEKGICPDKEIPQSDFDNFCKNVRFIDLREVGDPKKISQVIAGLNKENKLWAEPKVFAEAKIATNVFPTDPSIFKIRQKTAALAFPWILKTIMRFGVEKKTDYGGKQKEILNLAAVITDEDLQNPEIPFYFGFTKDQFNEQYLPQILTPNKIPGIEYTYGARLMNYQGIDQIKQGIIDKLKESIDSRRAVACTWQVEKDIESRQPPCLVLVQALAQNNFLHLTCYLRSNDMFKAWGQNALALRVLQGKIANELGLGLGVLTTISNSAHIYEQDFSKAQEIIDKHATGLKCEWDPRGNFAISVDKQNKKIIAYHYSPEGEKIGEYQGKTAQEIYLQIDTDLAVSQIGHSFYLGEELYKAQIALETGKEYKQDHNLF